MAEMKTENRTGKTFENGINIALTGMPGCGKSTLGVLLAKALNYSFTDTDLLIQTEEDRKLQDIIDTDGTEYFNRTENRIISGLKVKKTVIATGGSAVYGAEAMKNLSGNSIIVYIRLSCDEVIKRISNIKTRGISMRKGETLEELYRERSALYEKYADVVVDVCENTIEETVEALLEVLLK